MQTVTTATAIRGEPTKVFPQRLQPVRARADPMELVTLIISNSGLQRPLNLSLDVMKLREVERCANHITKYRSALNSLLDSAVILALEMVSHQQSDKLEEILRAVVRDGSKCNLKALAVSSPVAFKYGDKQDRMRAGLRDTLTLTFLSQYLFTLPSDGPSLPRYQGLSVLELDSALEPSSLPHLTALLQQQVSLKHIHICLLDNCGGIFDKHTGNEKELYNTLCSLFKRQQFALLSIHFICHHTLTPCSASSIKCHSFFPFSDLLKHFLQSACKKNQYLILGCINSRAPKKLPPLPGLGAGGKTLNCGVRHKILRYHINDVNVIVPYLLQLPVIRLQELCISIDNDDPSILDKASHHPSLNVAKLVIHFTQLVQPVRDPAIANLLSNLPKYFKRLFQMPSLEKVELSGQWVRYSEVRAALVAGLKQQSLVKSLLKISLQPSPSAFNYDEIDFKELWDAVFSLPQLEQVEVELSLGLSKSLTNMIGVISGSWKKLASKKQLKSLKLVLSRDDMVSEDTITKLHSHARSVTINTHT